MNAEAILNKIGEDARETAEQLKADANRKAEELKSASQAKVQALHDQNVKQAEAEAAALTDRMRRMAELENRKLLLEKKRQVMDEAFQSALAELCGQPTDKTRAFMMKHLTDAAQGDESLLVGAENGGWFDQRFLDELNQAVNGKVTLAEGRAPNVTGAVLVRGGTEVYLTYESLLESARIRLETEIAQILFNE